MGTEAALFPQVCNRLCGRLRGRGGHLSQSDIPWKRNLKLPPLPMNARDLTKRLSTGKWGRGKKNSSICPLQGCLLYFLISGWDNEINVTTSCNLSLTTFPNCNHWGLQLHLALAGGGEGGFPWGFSSCHLHQYYSNGNMWLPSRGWWIEAYSVKWSKSLLHHKLPLSSAFVLRWPKTEHRGQLTYLSYSWMQTRQDKIKIYWYSSGGGNIYNDGFLFLSFLTDKETFVLLIWS